MFMRAFLKQQRSDCRQGTLRGSLVFDQQVPGTSPRSARVFRIGQHTYQLGGQGVLQRSGQPCNRRGFFEVGDYLAKVLGVRTYDDRLRARGRLDYVVPTPRNKAAADKDNR